MTTITSDFDSRVLLKIMGARAAIEAKGINPTTLGLEKLGEDGKATRSLRTAIDSYLPSFYLVDVETIAKDTLNQLNPENKYFYSNVYGSKLTVKSGSIKLRLPGQAEPVSNVMSDYANKQGNFAQSDESTTTKMSDEEYNIYIEWYDRLVRNINVLISGLSQELDKIKKSIDFVELMTQLTNLRNRIAGQQNSGGKAIKTFADLKDAIAASFKTGKGSQFGKIKTEQAESLIEGFDSSKHCLLYGPSFDLVKTRAHTQIQDVFYRFFDSSVDIKLNSELFKVGNFVSAGHAGYRQAAPVGPGTKSTLYGVTPQLINASLILEIFGTMGSNNLPAQEDMANMVELFLLQTLHENHIINFKLNTNYSFDAGVLYDLGISFATSQNFSINSFELSPEENKLIRALINNYEESMKKLMEKIKNGMKPGDPIFDYMIRKVKRSPPLAKVLVLKAFSPLLKEKSNFPGKSTIDTIKMSEVVKSPKINRRSGKQPTKSTKKPSAPKSTLLKSTASKKVVQSTVNLSMLMLAINSGLHDQIKANMGTGTSSRVLNYRTGRLANSARVERLSESRQGMITAFYSYMKNPYATFSRGGRQEVPFTRDPKTLISKSIRELAGAQVANRMRAVLI